MHGVLEYTVHSQESLPVFTGPVSAALEYVYPVEAVDGQESLPVLSDPLF